MIRRLAKILFRVLWLLPGFLLWASFPPFGEKFDAIFALAPLLWLARKGERRRAAMTWFLNGCVFWCATLSWLPAIIKNGGPWPLVAVGWFTLTAYCALYFGAFGWLSASAWKWAATGAYWRRLAMIAVGEPLLWAGLEIVRSRFLGGFAWNLLGIPAINAGFGEPAAIGGVYLVSAMMILVSGTLASVAERMLDGIRPSVGVFAVPKWLRSVETLLPFALVFFVCSASSNLAATSPDEQDAQQNAAPMAVALVQRNFPCVFERDRPQDPKEEYSRLFSAVAAMRPSLVVLSESALAEFGAVGSWRAQAFADFAMSLTGAKGILAGGSRRDDEGRLFNSAALYTAGAAAPQIYDKTHLVPFGEFIPFDKTFPILKKLAPVGSCTPGELRLLDFDGIKVGVAICYEDTDSAQLRKLAKMGAQLLVFITNDSWFAHSEETMQHAWHSIARAIETGLPIVRVGNSGVTGSISAAGIPNWLGDDAGKPRTDSQGVMVDCVIPAHSAAALTPYVRFGDAPIASAFALLIAAILLREARTLRRKRLARDLIPATAPIPPPHTTQPQPENMV